MSTASLVLAASLVASGPWKMGTGEVIHVPGERRTVTLTHPEGGTHELAVSAWNAAAVKISH